MVALPQPGNSQPTSFEDPHRFNLIHDAYGPGPFLAWLLGAYALLLQLFSNLRERPQYRILDKDLFVTLSYPVFAAGHMFKQVFQYSGPKEEIWWTEWSVPKREITAAHFPAATAIQAAGKVCVAGLAINIALALRFRGTKWRRRAVVVAGIWELFCLVYATAASGWFVVLLSNILSIVFTGFCIIIPLSLLAVSTIGLRLMGNLVLWSNFSMTDPIKQMVKSMSVIFVVATGLLFTAGVYSLSVYGLMTSILMPQTAHSFFELFQTFAFMVGLVSAVLSLRDFWTPGQLGHAIWEGAGEAIGLG